MQKVFTICIATITIIIVLIVGFYTGRATLSMVQAINTNAANIQRIVNVLNQRTTQPTAPIK